MHDRRSVSTWASLLLLLLLVSGACEDVDVGSDPSEVNQSAGSGSTAGTSGAAGAGTGAAGRAGSSAVAGAAAGSGAVAGTGAAGTVSGAAGSPLAGVGAAGTTAGTGAAGSSGAPGGAGTAAVDPNAPPADACDRACLLKIMQGYIDALIAKEPSKLKVSAMLKYTENGVASMLGETVWKTATMLVPDTRLDFADPVEGNVASQFVFNEGSTPVIYQVRLKVVKQEITEIETMAVRQRGAANGFFNVANMKPEAVFLQPIEPAKRQKRDELKAITELYLEYLEGDTRAAMVPFDMGCKRYENGQVTASGLSSFNSQSWSFNLTHRILVIDEEAGITWGMFPFTQSATGLVVGEAFKIIDGKIMMIQAVMANQPTKVWD